MWPFQEDPFQAEKLEIYERAVEGLRNEPCGPQNDREWADLGRQLNRLAALRAPQNPMSAVAAYREAADIWMRLDRHKALIVSHMRLAVALARAGEHHEAQELIESLVDRALANPEFSLYADSIALHRGAVFCAIGELERAIEDLERVIEVRASRKPGSEVQIEKWLSDLKVRSNGS